MIDETPGIKTQTAECAEKWRTARVVTGGPTHTGWFHRSGRGRVQWIPADDGSLRTRQPEQTRHQQNFSTDAGSLSGRCPVGEVKGRRPSGLADFLGVTSFTVIRGELAYRVFGTGEPTVNGVLFRQQDLNSDGKEIRTWLLTAAQEGIVADPSG